MTRQKHLRRGLPPTCRGAEQLRKKIVKSGAAEGKKELFVWTSREVTEDLMRRVKVSFESLTGALLLAPMNSCWWGGPHSLLDPGT
jgi:hypothetical protein